VQNQELDGVQWSQHFKLAAQIAAMGENAVAERR
jgi:hypothetical protein